MILSKIELHTSSMGPKDVKFVPSSAESLPGVKEHLAKGGEQSKSERAQQRRLDFRPSYGLLLLA